VRCRRGLGQLLCSGMAGRQRIRQLELVISLRLARGSRFQVDPGRIKGAKVLLAPSILSGDTEVPEREPFQLVSLRLRATGGVIEAILDPPPARRQPGQAHD